MQPKIEQLTTPEIKSCVNAYLMSRAYAETMREKVNAVHKEILTECPIYADKNTRIGLDHGKQILESKDLYLCSNDSLCQDFYDESDYRLKKLGIKPESMDRDYCPALVAESLQVKAEQLLIETAGKPFNITNNGLLCTKNGLENRQKFIDLIVGLIVNQPDFKNPITGK